MENACSSTTSKTGSLLSRAVCADRAASFSADYVYTTQFLNRNILACALKLTSVHSRFDHGGVKSWETTHLVVNWCLFLCKCVLIIKFLVCD